MSLPQSVVSSLSPSSAASSAVADGAEPNDDEFQAHPIFLRQEAGKAGTMALDPIHRWRGAITLHHNILVKAGSIRTKEVSGRHQCRRRRIIRGEAVLVMLEAEPDLICASGMELSVLRFLSSTSLLEKRANNLRFMTCIRSEETAWTVMKCT